MDVHWIIGSLLALNLRNHEDKFQCFFSTLLIFFKSASSLPYNKCYSFLQLNLPFRK